MAAPFYAGIKARRGAVARTKLFSGRPAGPAARVLVTNILVAHCLATDAGIRSLALSRSFMQHPSRSNRYAQCNNTMRHFRYIQMAVGRRCQLPAAKRGFSCQHHVSVPDTSAVTRGCVTPRALESSAVPAGPPSAGPNARAVGKNQDPAYCCAWSVKGPLITSIC